MATTKKDVETTDSNVVDTVSEVGEVANTDLPIDLAVSGPLMGSVLGTPANGVPGASQFAALVGKQIG